MAVIEITNAMPGTRQRAAAGSTGGGVIELTGAAAPTVNVTGLGVAVVGSRYTDTTTGIVYACTATNSTSTIVWTKVGLQT